MAKGPCRSDEDPCLKMDERRSDEKGRVSVLRGENKVS